MVDYHVHPNFSEDAQGSISDFCGRAVELELEEVCFTTHYEPDPVRREHEHVRVGGRELGMDSDWPRAYFAEIEGARQEFSGLVIRAGVEVGYEMGLEGMVSDFLELYPFDFVLGAVHCLDHVAITSGDELEVFKREFQDKDVKHIVTRYFDYVQAAAGSGLFDCLAHLDIYRKYIQSLFGPEFGMCAERLLGPALELIARVRVGIEVNSSAFRRGSDEPYPEERIVRLARKAGVEVFTIGSDAHRPEDLGKGLERAERILAGIGVRPARFESRHRVG